MAVSDRGGPNLRDHWHPGVHGESARARRTGGGRRRQLEEISNRVRGRGGWTVRRSRSVRPQARSTAPGRCPIPARTEILVSPYTVDMPINDLLLTEFDEEVKKTRTTLERVPTGKGDFAPHPKSMPLGKLAPHIAQLGGFGLTILTEPGLDFSQRRMTPLPYESGAQLVRAFDESVGKVRDALQNVPDSAWTEPWKLSFQGKTIFQGTRFLA